MARARGWRWLLLLVGAAAAARADEAVLDRVENALTWATPGGAARGRVSGLLDSEVYALPRVAPGVIDAEGATLWNPRLSVYLDAQVGDTVYLFAQARGDRGFDPAPERMRARLDEYALRWTPFRSGGLNIQIGRFASVVGNWNPRHDSWSNPFITAPVPYENLTGVWDNIPPRSAGQLLTWSHVRPGLAESVSEEEKYLRIPMIWGPSYAAGVAVAGELGRFRYAFEVKNAALSSRPQAWSTNESHWDHPTVSGRVRWVPSAEWEFGWSASSGAFLRPGASLLLPPGRGRGDYREELVGQDVTFAWHHWQVWAELYAVRFRLPPIGNADTAAYYVEARYRFGPTFSFAGRWNQQLYGTIAEAGSQVRWGRDLWRVDLAPAWRCGPHTQVKLQYSLLRGERQNDLEQLVAAQFTLRF